MKPKNSTNATLTPAFDAPWQAQVYAPSQVLIESGLIKADAWAEELGTTIKRRQADGAADTVEEYLKSACDALVSILPVEPAEFHGLMNEWRAAYEAPPHGKPVKLQGVWPNAQAKPIAPRGP